MARLNYKEVLKGDKGTTFTPHVTEEGLLYWKNDGGLINPTPVNIQGKQGEQGEIGRLTKEQEQKIDRVINDYNDAISNLTNGNENATNSEIVQARNGEVNLNRRLDKFDSQLEHKVSYPVLDWEKVEGIDFVKDITFPYGHVKRYGAKGNGVDDDSKYFQDCFNVCSSVGQKILVKDGIFVIKNSIKLKKAYDGNDFSEYNVEGDVLTINRHDQNTKIDSRKGVILCDCDLFEGLDFEDYRFSMRNVQVKFLQENKYTLLKNVALVNSFIEKNYIIYAKTILNGYMKYLCKIKNNHFHFIGCLILCPSEYVSVDSYIEDNYLLGYRDSNPSMIQAQLDQTVFIINNFIDQWKFVFSTYDDPNGMIKTGYFMNNDVNICFRLIETNLQIDFSVISNNHFINCNKKRGLELFANASDDMVNGKWGGVIYDDRTSRQGVSNINTLILTNNVLYESDCLLYYVSTSFSSKKILKELEEVNNVNANIVFEQNADYNAFKKVKLNSLNYSEYEELPNLYNSSNNSFSFFENCFIWVNGELYISKVISNNPVWKKINLS